MGEYALRIFRLLTFLDLKRAVYEQGKLNNLYQKEYRHRMPHDVVSTVMGLLQEDPEFRYSAIQALESAWFSLADDELAGPEDTEEDVIDDSD